MAGAAQPAAKSGNALLECLDLALRDKSQAENLRSGIGWKADIGRQVVSAKPVAIDPLRNSLVQCHHTFRVHHGGHSSLADLSEFGYPVPYQPSTHFQTWVSQESMSEVEARESVSVGC